jgi:hypothetical protein
MTATSWPNAQRDSTVLTRLVGCWAGTVQHRAAADQPFVHLPGTSENRWVLEGRFVEMTLRAGGVSDSWSAVFYIGYERSERRHVQVSLGPGDRQVTTRRGGWTLSDANRLLLLSEQGKTTCDLTTPGELKLELEEQSASGHDFVRFRADYRPASAAVVPPPVSRQTRRFVIA